MSEILEQYTPVVGKDLINQLYQLAEPLKGKRVVHVNSPRVGGGVAEILTKLVPLMESLGMDTSWEVITGEEQFYQCTKGFHNGLQGNAVEMPAALYATYEEANRQNAQTLRPILEEADIAVIHDPQPAPLITHCPDRKGKWVWRCHIDASRPFRPVWRYLRKFVAQHDASIFSLADFAQPLPHPLLLPLSCCWCCFYRCHCCSCRKGCPHHRRDGPRLLQRPPPPPRPPPPFLLETEDITVPLHTF